MTRNCYNVMRKVASMCKEAGPLPPHLANAARMLKGPNQGYAFPRIGRGMRLYATPQAVAAAGAAARSWAAAAVGATGFALGDELGKRLVAEPNKGQKLYMPPPTEQELYNAAADTEYRRRQHGLSPLTNSKYSPNYKPSFWNRLFGR